MREHSGSGAAAHCRHKWPDGRRKSPCLNGCCCVRAPKGKRWVYRARGGDTFTPDMPPCDDPGLIGPLTDLEVGDRVYHVPDPETLGTVRVVEDNRLSVMVEWDDCPGDWDFQWANKVARAEVG